MSSRALVRVPVAPGPAGVTALLSHLGPALDGSGPAIAPIPTTSMTVSDEYIGALLRATRPDAPLDDATTAVVLSTSGSTGAPRGVELSAAAVQASADAAAAHLGIDVTDAAWVVAIPVTSAGGFNVVARAHLSGRSPQVLPSVAGAMPYRPEQWVDAVRAAVRAAPSSALCTSMVPAQLHRVLEDAAAVSALAQFAVILIGGARLSDELRSRAGEAGLRIVRTYGLTETCGGCVYDGRALAGIGLRCSADGEIEVSGPTLMQRYRLDPEATTRVLVDGWLHTGDLGRIEDAVLTVDGRRDDIVTVKGTSVALGAVESVLTGLRGIGEVAVIAVDARDGGHEIVAFATGQIDADSAEAAVQGALGRAAVPRFLWLPSLPRLAGGKVDRAALIALTHD